MNSIDLSLPGTLSINRLAPTWTTDLLNSYIATIDAFAKYDNVLAYNVGYHNEHHDFPSIPWTRLAALRALAPEYYDNIPSHPSWPMVIVNFIRDPEVGIFARVKRRPKDRGGQVAAAAAASGCEKD